ncbi:unnamed protein product [Discosporangium mesarthrocarpum]
MPYIARTHLPENKVLVHSLSHILGLGLYQSKILCQKLGLALNVRLSELSPKQIKDLSFLVESSSLLIGSDLRKVRKDRLKHLCRINCYRGFRHRKGLPVRGQRTHTNSKPRPVFKF